MKKVALISPYPLNERTPYTSRQLRYCAYTLKKFGMHCEFFSFSDKPAAKKVFGFKQHTIKSQRPLGSEFSTTRYMDLLSLALFGFRPSIERINDSPEFLNKLKEYDPGLVILVDIIIAKLMKKYSEQYKRPDTKIICYTDSYRGVPTEIDDNIKWLKETAGGPVKIGSIKLLKRNYVKYYRSMYEQQLKIADAFIAPAEEHRRVMQQEFPQFKSKIFGFNFEWHDLKPNNTKPRKKLDTIVFIGSYNHIPNAMAIKNVTQIIAPRMPQKKFIIFGVDCPNKKEGNVQFIDGTTIPTSTVLKKADVCLAPFTTYNAGMKTKIYDYVQANRIIIGTRSGFTGYAVVNKKNAVIEDDIRKYPDRIRELERNYALRSMIQRNVYTVLDNSRERVVDAKWKALLKYIGM